MLSTESTSQEQRLGLRLFASFFKIGAFTFGGGWAMISIIEREIVDKHSWLSREDFMDQVIVAQSLPGVLAVNMATAVGDRLAGSRGGVIAALGAVLPSFLIILAIAIFLTPEQIKTNPVIASVFLGMRPAVVALIVAPMITSAKVARITWRTVWIPLVVALMISLNLGAVSSPILYVVLGALGGYAHFWWSQRRLQGLKGGAK